MSLLDELIEKVGPNFRLRIESLEGYKKEAEYVSRAKEILKTPKKLYPDLVDKKYEDAFEHGFIEASVDAYDENKLLRQEIEKLKYMIDNGLGWEDLKDDTVYPPRD